MIAKAKPNKRGGHLACFNPLVIFPARAALPIYSERAESAILISGCHCPEVISEEGAVTDVSPRPGSTLGPYAVEFYWVVDAERVIPEYCRRNFKYVF